MTKAFEQLVKQFANGGLNKGRFVASFNQFLRQNPSIEQALLLKIIKKNKKDGILDSTQSRFLNETIKTSVSSQQIGGSQHTIVPTEVLDEDNDTLIYHHNSPDVDNDATLVSQTHFSQKGDDPEEDIEIYDSEESKPDNILKIGSVIKSRFVLIEMLGRGGMGIVYKARDLVKVQAQDSNPYVAVKVLTEAFKKHSSSFIALQREASKAQRLAHPNIATVYDFDHDGGSVYMTMELMVGQNLQKLIKEMPKTGLPKDIALNYIRQLAAGLAYAHKQQLIHCDLKPANIFLTDDGTIKLLDFGITRAIKRKSDDIDEETTIFDPKVLKALTPAYASIEMFSGEDPDPRDDIYGLGCVAYELLAGAHPYKKVPAHKANELGLKPPAIKKLSRKELSALHGTLELERKKRTSSVDRFLAELNNAKDHLKEILIGSIAILIIGFSFLAMPLFSQYQEDKELDQITIIQNGDQAALVALLKKLPNMDFNTQISLTSILRKEILTYYQTQINNVISVSEGNYNYPEAFRLLNEVKQFYTDSRSLDEAHKTLTNNRENLIRKLEESYKIFKHNDIEKKKIIRILREADPYHPLLRK